MRITKSHLYIIFFCVILIPICSFAASTYGDVVEIGNFSKKDLDGWKKKSFAGETIYKINTENKKSYLHAKSIQSASALYKKIKVNINETPYLTWSWRIDEALSQLNERDKAGDDYAARIYIVFKTGLTPLSAKALNYIWSSGDSIKTTWPNAYTNKAIMIPLRCNVDKNGTWYTEKINVREDLLKHFGKLPKFIHGVAIMTDTDNTKNSASASYGDIYFSRK